MYSTVSNYSEHRQWRVWSYCMNVQAVCTSSKTASKSIGFWSDWKYTAIHCSHDIMTLSSCHGSYYIWTITLETLPSDIGDKGRIKSACEFMQSDLILCCHWLFKMPPLKIQIRLPESTGWSESSLGAHVRRYIFWCCGSWCGILSEMSLEDETFTTYVFKEKWIKHSSSWQSISLLTYKPESNVNWVF